MCCTMTRVQWVHFQTYGVNTSWVPTCCRNTVLPKIKDRLNLLRRSKYWTKRVDPKFPSWFRRPSSKRPPLLEACSKRCQVRHSILLPWCKSHFKLSKIRIEKKFGKPFSYANYAQQGYALEGVSNVGFLYFPCMILNSYLLSIDYGQRPKCNVSWRSWGNHNCS
jgi:hypothetical protein